jgi:hypothetical protein
MVVVGPPGGEHRPACARLVKIVSFKHSSLSRALKLSMNPFCCGLPGAM